MAFLHGACVALTRLIWGGKGRRGTLPGMEIALLLIAAGSLTAWLVITVDGLLGDKYVQYVDHVALPDARQRAALPRVTVVVPARDEERNIEAAMSSLLALEYPKLEIIAVDDRSADGTGAILERLSAGDARLQVVHVGELPAGWLGKNHALQLGAERGSGELILFTDADVLFEPTVLLRAVTCLRDQELDHLTIAADVHTPSLLVELFVAAFMLSFVGYFRPWRMGDPKSSHTIGVGAFNLVRRQAYERAGRHVPIAMRPDDDLQLARLLRDHGARQAFGVAGGMVGVEWYPSLGAAIRGLEKNSLAGVGYRPWVLLGAAPAQLVSMCWPFLAI
ncbi:MAG: glycosyltransferase family 2 protein, partial [Acidobacteriota bacterium]